jgi:serine/threonine-protein kinase
MWKDAERVARHGLTIEPHGVDMMIALLYSLTAGSGDVQQARQLLATFPAENKLVTSTLISFAWLIGERAEIYVMATDFEAALKVWEDKGVTPADERRHLAASAAIHVLAGDSDREQREAEKARGLLEQRLQEQPKDTSAMVELSWVYLALKRNAEAVKLAQQTVAVTPPEFDVWLNIGAQIGLAEIEARAGQSPEAIAILQRLLTTPGGAISVVGLKLDPMWDPIRNDPAFQELLTIKERVGP